MSEKEKRIVEKLKDAIYKMCLIKFVSLNKQIHKTLKSVLK